MLIAGFGLVLIRISPQSFVWVLVRHGWRTKLVEVLFVNGVHAGLSYALVHHCVLVLLFKPRRVVGIHLVLIKVFLLNG